LICSTTCLLLSSFFLHAPSASFIFSLSLHDALPIFSFLTDFAVLGIFIFMPGIIISGLDNCEFICFSCSKSTPYFLAISHKVSPDRKSTRLNSSHVSISYAVFCLKKKKKQHEHALDR